MRVKTVADVYDEILDASVAPALVAQGFKRSRLDTFYRIEGNCVWKIAFVLSSKSGGAHGNFTGSVCVGFPELALFLKDFPQANIKETRRPCTMAAALNYLRPPHNWPEWAITSTSNPQTLGFEFAKVLIDHGLPFFEEFGSLEKAVAAWEQGVTHNLTNRAEFYLAAAYWIQGNREKALRHTRSCIAHYEKTYQAQKSRSVLSAKKEREAFLAFLENFK